MRNAGRIKLGYYPLPIDGGLEHPFAPCPRTSQGAHHSADGRDSLAARLNRICEISDAFRLGVGDDIDYCLTKYVKHPGLRAVAAPMPIFPSPGEQKTSMQSCSKKCAIESIVYKSVSVNNNLSQTSAAAVLHGRARDHH